MLIKRFSLLELYTLLEGNSLSGGEFDNLLKQVRLLGYKELQYEFYLRASQAERQAAGSQYSTLSTEYHTAVIEHCELWLAIERMFVKKREIYFDEKSVAQKLGPEPQYDAAREKYLALAEVQFLAEAKLFYEDRPAYSSNFVAKVLDMESELDKQRKLIETFLHGEKFKPFNQVMLPHLDRVFFIMNVDGFSDNPFLKACADGNVACIKENMKRLSEIGRMKRSRTRTDFYNMHERAVGGHEDIYYAIHLAVIFGQGKVLEELLGKENQYPVDQKTIQGYTALHIACRMGAVDLVKILLAAGADVNVKGPDDCTALHIACRMGAVDLVKILLAAGADVNVKGPDDCTALHIACRMGAVGLVKILLAAGADVNVKGPDDRTPLHEAAANGHADVVLLLLDQKKINVMAKDKAENTALHHAITMPLPWDAEVGRFTLVVSRALVQQETIVKALVTKDPKLTKICNAAKQSPLDLVFVHQAQTLQSQLPGSQTNASPGGGLSDAMGNLLEQTACIQAVRELLDTQTERRTKALSDNMSDDVGKLKRLLSDTSRGIDVTIHPTKREKRLFELRAGYVVPTFGNELGARKTTGVIREPVIPPELAYQVEAAMPRPAAGSAGSAPPPLIAQRPMPPFAVSAPLPMPPSLAAAFAARPPAASAAASAARPPA